MTEALARIFKEEFEQQKEEGFRQGVAEGLEKGFEQGIEKGIEKGIEQGIEKGIEKGIKKGIEQGIEKGYEQGRFQFAVDLVTQGVFTYADAARQIGMAEEDFVKKAKNYLEKNSYFGDGSKNKGLE